MQTKFTPYTFGGPGWCKNIYRVTYYVFMACILFYTGYQFIHVEHAMYGRLVPDDGSPDNCVYGGSNRNN